MEWFTQWDESCLHFLSEWGSDLSWLSPVSSGLASVLFLAAFAAIFDRPLKWFTVAGRFVGIVLILALSMSLASNLKERIGRPRPDTYVESDSKLQRSANGMPSSHAVLLGLSAGVISARWSVAAIQVSVGLLAIGMGFVRVAKGLHFPTDVLAGWTLGMILGWAGWLLVTSVLCRRTDSEGSQLAP